MILFEPDIKRPIPVIDKCLHFLSFSFEVGFPLVLTLRRPPPCILGRRHCICAINPALAISFAISKRS
jgi:hypothetical protein